MFWSFFIVFLYVYLGATPENEIQIYTWMDASLKEITGLVKEVNPDARKWVLLVYLVVCSAPHGLSRASSRNVRSGMSRSHQW